MELKHLKTEPVSKLLEEVEDLLQARIIVQKMTDASLLMESDGAAVRQEEDGTQIVYIDPARADEYAFAHELVRMILHCSGWPQMYGMIDIYTAARRLAETIDNTINHYLVNDRLALSGIDVDRHKEKFVGGFQHWKAFLSREPLNTNNVLLILEALLMGQPYREDALNIIAKTYPKTTRLALELEKAVSAPLLKITKRGSRSAMINTLVFFDKWLSQQKGSPVNLDVSIGISPLFTPNQLKQKADAAIDMVAGTCTVNNKNLWLHSFLTKKDRIRFHTYVAYNPFIETAIETMTARWRSLPLKTLLEEEGIRFGLRD